MEFDIFLSISQTPDASGHMPDEQTMMRNYFDQVEAADRQGFGIAWIAQAHLSTEEQKSNLKPVVPHFPGEIGLCTDFFQLAGATFSRTKNIEVGSAVLSILANGGPITTAERIGNLCQLLGLQNDGRKVHVGFSAGRFEFMARPYGIVPRNSVESAAWPVLRNRIFREATEIVLRLIRGDAISSEDIQPTILRLEDFRDGEDWAAVQLAAKNEYDLPALPNEVHIARRYAFENLKIIPKNWPRDKLNLVLGSHDADTQIFANQFMPVQVFNLSITPPEVIDATHQRMEENYHPDGGKWERRMMPRTLMIFLNEEEDLNPEQRSSAAKKEADAALRSYWSALDGTIDPDKVERATDNAVIGNAEEVATQILERFNHEDRIMCWFDFFNHDSARVIRNMEAFMSKVKPLVEERLQ
jgi:alkanesulfonate monooxygenase SsuD/methylene tetrahydromethanopterin reductase-like flavin-dependent oxidoreductase (luciferase family)